MKVCLLYRDTDRENFGDGAYDDPAGIVQDLGLGALFSAAGRRLVRLHGEVVKVEKEDPFLSETLRRVMMLPLRSREEVLYRQEVLRDFLGREELLRQLYRLGCETTEAWNALGRGFRENGRQGNPVRRLSDELAAVHLVCDALAEIRQLLTREDPETGKRPCDTFTSEGLRGFYDRFSAAFPPEREQAVRGVLADVAFFTDPAEEGGPDRPVRAAKPHIVLECGLEDGLRFSSLKLAEVSSESLRFFRPGTTLRKLQDIRYSRIPDSFPVEKDMRLSEQAKQLEYGVVSYLAENVLAGLTEEFFSFFDQLRLQSAFYLGAFQLLDSIAFYGMGTCFPEVTDRETLEFRELQECAMGLSRRMTVVGNSCRLSGRRLLIVTGANQGGKSTFLRSIGIAQVMLQSGLPVAAESFRGGLFPGLFVHFTRREDSSMNSGRLDEELGRMSRIVDRVGEGSLVLLNESFATTTEKEGSVIAYDIVRALTETGVKVFMVTHLLSFARRMYAEAGGRPESGVEFLSAERKENGTRTFRMIQHVPEMTSFGLDLYEEIVEKRKR